MPRVIYIDQTVDFSNCELNLTNCKLRMKNCEVICDDQAIKDQIEHLKAETEKYEQIIKFIIRQKQLLREEMTKISRKRSGSF